MLHKKFVISLVLAFVFLSLFVTPSLAATSTPSPHKQPDHTYATLSNQGKPALEVCTASLSAGQNNPTQLEGSTTVDCNVPLEIIIDSYADYCNAGAFGICWGGWSNRAVYPQCGNYTTHLFCGTWYKVVGRNQIWRFRSEICISFTDGTQCTEEYKTVSF